MVVLIYFCCSFIKFVDKSVAAHVRKPLVVTAIYYTQQLDDCKERVV